MNARKRLERLEAEIPVTSNTKASLALEVYFKRLENERRKQARKPPIPLTPEEERFEREADNDPEFRAYWEKLDKQRKESIWREET